MRGERPGALRYEHYLLAMDEWVNGPPGQKALDHRAKRLIEGGANEILRDADTAASRADDPEIPMGFDGALVKRMRALTLTQNATTFLLLVAALAIALDCPVSNDVVIIGGVINGRENPRFRTAVGYFSDRMYWSIDLSGSPPFTEVLRRVRRAVADTAQFQYVRSDHLRERLREAGRGFSAPVLNFRTAPEIVGPRSSVLDFSRGVGRRNLGIRALESSPCGQLGGANRQGSPSSH
jgi:hypothetical protein